ncbi:PIG-L deacetylase family protein [Methylocella sp.]|uniref:PIG-L deacetylase family protein n=1 Tax=Methylocella sp. TaxID=1978226 RepID=UPI0037838BD2
MKAGAFFEAARRLPFAPLARIVGRGGALVLAPHPDDESLGCGGLIAMACAEGRPVRVIVVSDGCGSHPNSRSHPPERLRALREAETLAAAAALGLAAGDVDFLRLPDRHVPHEGAAARAAVARVVAAARDIGASALFATWGFDPHCDHQAVWRIAEAARRALPGLALMSYPVWGFALPADAEVGTPPQGFRLDVAAVSFKKRRAIAAHRSQLTDMIDNDPPVVILPPQALAPFREPVETFFEAGP